MRAGVRNKEQDHPAPPPAHRRRPCLAVIQSPPGWEVGVYAAGALALLGIAAVSLWRLWASGSFPSPSPFPNYDYRYLQRKYGEASAEAGRKVRLLCPQVHPRLPPRPCCPPSASAFVPSPLMSPLGMRVRPTLPYAPAAPSQGGKEGRLPSSEAACGAGCLRWPLSPRAPGSPSLAPDADSGRLKHVVSHPRWSLVWLPAPSPPSPGHSWLWQDEPVDERGSPSASQINTNKYF